ncbi:hypothetical protein AAF712_003435 [Marasmius tenuissimus]|uniref:BZIP domain-containing protein n=1 Tax=Marasmius tenuissimus TaxID=585030 RepID=A0ABR3A7C6_9AGAR|nr:hypothetical protein PM082_003899 [Marasmius tenuissimus]
MASYDYTNNSYLTGYPQQQQHHHQHQNPGPNISMYSPISNMEHLSLLSPTSSDPTLSPPAPPAPTTFYEYPLNPAIAEAQYHHYAEVSHEAAIPVDPRRYIQPSPVDTSFNQAPRAGPSRPQTTRRARVDPHPYSSVPRRRPNSHLQIQSSDDEELEELPPNATEKQKLQYQRHRNTLAARRSRKKKEMYKQELEQMVDQLTMETEKWKTRAEMLRRMLESQGLGLACPDWSE